MAATKLNGVDVSQLNETIKLIKQKPEIAKFKFRAKNDWLNGSKNHSSITDFDGAGQEHQKRSQKFDIQTDEPLVLLGSDKAPSPTEYLLHSLAACMTSTLVYHAAEKGIKIEKIDSNFEGDIDIRGFLNMSKDVPKGYQEIRANFKVKTKADKEALKELFKFSPVHEMVSARVPVKINLETY